MTNVEIELTDEQFISLAREAHKQNITLNELCIQILKDYLDENDNDIYNQMIYAATRKILNDGIIESTLIDYGEAYHQFKEEKGFNWYPNKQILKAFDDDETEREAEYQKYLDQENFETP